MLDNDLVVVVSPTCCLIQASLCSMGGSQPLSRHTGFWLHDVGLHAAGLSRAWSMWHARRVFPLMGLTDRQRGGQAWCCDWMGLPGCKLYVGQGLQAAASQAGWCQVWSALLSVLSYTPGQWHEDARQDKTRITPVPASQADEVSDLILIRSRLAHA